MRKNLWRTLILLCLLTGLALRLCLSADPQQCHMLRSNTRPDRSHLRKSSSAFLREPLLCVSQRRAADRRSEPRDFQDGSFTHQRSSNDEADSRKA